MTQPQSSHAGRFSRFAGRAADLVGTPAAFAVAMASVVLWLAGGPGMHYSDTWQLIMNSWTNVVTFGVVFLIQHAQNRDSKAINLKLDEIIRSTAEAEDELIDIEKLSDEDLQRLEKRYEAIRARIRHFKDSAQ
jgi:low affinity Fe/Cu permease